VHVASLEQCDWRQIIHDVAVWREAEQER
jgi:hypothetical protein